MAKVDASKFHAKLRGLEQAGRSADEAAVIVLGGFFLDTLVPMVPRDTNRAVNGWIQAGREAGVTHMPMLPYNASSRRAEFLKQLEREIAQRSSYLEFLESLKKRADDEDRSKAGRRRRDGKAYARRAMTPSYRKLLSRINRARFRLRRVQEEYEKALGSEAFLFFDSRRTKRNFSTVRDKIYGGTGRMEVDAHGARLELINREPHFRFIERDPRFGHPYATSMALVRSAGFQLAGNRWLEVARRRLPRAA